MDTTELVSWFRMAQIDPYFGTAIQGRFEQAADTIERQAKDIEGYKLMISHLVKERDDLSKRLERMHRPRCDGYSDDPKGPWPLLENPCQFCGARSESDACRDMSDTADCDKIRAQRDAALAEVERLEKRVETERSKAPLRSWTCVPCQSLFPLHSRGRPICSKCGELMSESA